MTMIKVSQAQFFQPHEMGSLGKAAGMYIRQHQFPYEFDKDKDEFISVDLDRLQQQDHENASRCLQEHSKTKFGFHSWVNSASIKKMMAFLKDILKVKEYHPDVKFTGFRILYTVNRSNGHPVWSFQFFANNSGVKTYDGNLAPNVKIPKSNMVYWDYNSWLNN